MKKHTYFQGLEKQWHTSCHLTHDWRFRICTFLFSFPLGQSFYINTALRHPRERKRPGRLIFCSSQPAPTINSQVPTKRAFSRPTSNQTHFQVFFWLPCHWDTTTLKSKLPNKLYLNEQSNSIPGVFSIFSVTRFHISMFESISFDWLIKTWIACVTCRPSTINIVSL